VRGRTLTNRRPLIYTHTNTLTQPAAFRHGSTAPLRAICSVCYTGAYGDQPTFLSPVNGGAMQLSMPLTMRPRLPARYRAARLGLAALLGILFGATLIWFPDRFAASGQFGAPLFGVVFLPPVLSLFLDARVRRSWRALLSALGGLALIVAGEMAVNILFISTSSTRANVNPPVGTALYGAYILSIPLIIAAAAAFTGGGLGGYAARWKLTAMGAGVLAWTGTGALVLPLAYVWFFVLRPYNQATAFMCLGPSIFSFLVMIFVGGLVVALLGGLLGGAQRAWVGRSAQAG
jgi:hypothetical protein